MILDGYEKIGCDAINVGHYELAAGLPFLKEMDTECDIPFISANLRDTGTGELLFDPYVEVRRAVILPIWQFFFVASAHPFC